MRSEPQRYKMVMRFSTKRQGQLRRSRAGAAILLVLMSGLFLLFLWLGYRDVITLRDLQARGRTTYARIMDKRIYSGKSTSYYLYYTFMAEETIIQGRASVARSRFYALRVGGPLLVTYLPANPSVNRAGIVDAARIHRAQMGWWIVFFLFVVLMALIAWTGFYPSRARKAVVRRIL